MPREQVLYKIFKLDSTFICENNLNIENYSIKQAELDGRLVSAGDCIAFTQIRHIRGDNRSYKDIFKDAMFSQKCMRKSKKEGKQKEAQLFSQKLNNDLFIKDVVCVQANTKNEYRQIAKAGFYVNGKRYVRGSASAGQIRHNCVYFFCDEVYPELFKRLMCDLNNRITEMNIAKLSAYFALSTSSVLWVDTPRVCVVKDFYTTLKNQKIDWITNTDDGKKTVEERITDVKMNSCDGQGLISPKMAQRWSSSMGIDYVASSYVVRNVFVKGNLVPFDFEEYGKEHKIYTIVDRWGNQHNLSDIDVILSESQFKMYKYYKSWEDFSQYLEKYNIQWGVSRYNRKYDDEYVLANYQIVQVLNINEQDAKQLIQPTIDWINKICTGDDLYALLYSMGGFYEDDEVYREDVYEKAQSTAMMAVAKNIKFLKDTYVQKRIYRNIVESINKSKIGKIWVRGNYSFMISDPISQCRSALGLDPTGEIPGEYIYSNFWNERKEKLSDIVLCRSPLLDKHEVNHCKLYQSEEANKWYSWIKSGIIYSIYDLSTLRHSDSDSTSGSVDW